MKQTIKANEIGNTIIKCYRTVNSKQGIECTLYEFLTKVTAGCRDLIETLRNIEDTDQQKQFKTFNIPCATISIVAGEDKSIEHCKQKNNLIVIDIDEHDNPQLNNEVILINTGYNLFNLPYVYAVGRSCRGKGLFAIIPIADIENIKKHFDSIRHDFEQLNIIIDKQCSNINRLRFATYDEKLVDNTWIKEEDVEVYDKVAEEETAIPTLSANIQQTVIPANSLLLDNVFIMKAMMMLVSDCGYTSDDYYSWLQDGFRLATLGEQLGFFLFLMISRKSRGYRNDADVQRKFAECLRCTKMDRTSIAYYFGCLKKKLGSNWIQTVQKYVLPTVNN